ncbi:alpha/beta fold hydrolase [Lachnobacterium bovis]|uniref:alpha/beta fold hydrolase n=1 Tax=Lachnobacterium bovis TaxID=140626 RepID=UPI0003B345F0|nr:alpha/beta fold hydrolase [Lachnobacterium bovis]
MSIRENFTLLSNNGKTKINCVTWKPENGKCKGVVQLIHGMIEYIDRYSEFAEFLTQNEFVVVGHDHLGHGKSIDSEEDYGFFDEERPSNVLIADIHNLKNKMQEEYKDVPYFLLGHSMGSYMLRKYIALYNRNVDGVIIMGTGFVAPKTTLSGMKFAKIIKKFKGSHHRSKTLENLTFGKSYNKFDKTGADVANSWLTKDQDIVKKYYSDPLCTFKFTVNGYLGLLEAVLFSCKLENVDRIPKNIPFLFVSGEDDPVGDFGKGVKKIYDMFNLTNHKDVTMKLYKNDRHEILHETDKEIVYKDILNWINSRAEK